MRVAISRTPYAKLCAFDDETDDLNVVIETPQGSRNKYKYDLKQGLFTLSKVLPAGNAFPFDFGYIPSTKGPDGDPLDVLVLMDEKVFSGCLINARLIGVIEAKQIGDGQEVRNDRLITVASESKDQRDVHSLSELNPRLVEEIEEFFISYHALDGVKFEPVARHGPKKALKLVQKYCLGRQRIPAQAKKTDGKPSKKG